MFKKFKKILAIALISLFVVPVAACGNGGGGGSDDDIVEMLYVGWNNIPVSDDYSVNPYKKYIDETYGIDYKLSLTNDLQTELSKRFSSRKTRKPDVIMFNTDQYTSMKILYNQGFFIEDYTPYLDEAPQFAAIFQNNNAAKTKLTENGKIIALTLPGEQPVWMHKIRKDWVEQYSPTGEIPETVNELLQMAANVKSATNGESYLFTGAGEGEDFDTLNNFQYMFGDYNDWYVNEGGEVSHPILDGSRKKFLDFLKTVQQNGYIDPNWYIQSWGGKKGLLNSGRIGIDWYPPAIATDYLFHNDDNEATASGIWANMPMPTDTAGVTRKGAATSTFRNFVVLSSELEKNPEKLATVLRLLNDLIYPYGNEENKEDSLYMKIRWGVGIDNYVIGEGKELEPIYDENDNDTGFITYYYAKNPQNKTRYSYGASWDYGVFMATTDDKVVEYLNATSYGQSAYDYIDLYNGAVEYYSQSQNFNYMEMLNLNANLSKTLKDLTDEFEISYVRGTNTVSYETFVNQWKSYGGDTLKSAARLQFKAAGYIE